jgi:hypothetical protein
MVNLHEQTHQNIAAANAKYQVAGSKGKKHVTFESCDMVWLHLRKDRFPTLRRSKLMPRAAGPFKVLSKINDNACILDLPVEFGVSTSFNVVDLKPYLGEDEELPSRTTSVQEGEDDEDTTSTSTPAAPPTSAPAAPSSAPPFGPITRSRAREFNFVMMLKNEGPKTEGCPNRRPCVWAPRTGPRGRLGLHLCTHDARGSTLFAGCPSLRGCAPFISQSNVSFTT